MEFYKLATRKNPHPYPNYFADFTVLQRLQVRPQLDGVVRAMVGGVATLPCVVCMITAGD